MWPRTEIVYLKIGSGSNSKEGINRFRPKTYVRIQPDVSILGTEVILYTNYPEKGVEFQRTRARPICSWLVNNRERFNCKNTDNSMKDVKVSPLLITRTDIYIEEKMSRPGTYLFWLSDVNRNVTIDELYIQIEPVLNVGYGNNEHEILLEEICCQTVHSKLLGPINTWESRLQVSKETSYNMIHFTPIQELGASGSSYSVKNQLQVNQEFSSQPGMEVTFEDVAEVILKCRQEWGISSICDIVLNHTANESEWLLEHPEATYSCATCPHLRPAFLLDVLLTKCSRDICNGDLEIVGIPALITNQEHVNILREKVLPNYLQLINIHELYQCNVDKIVNNFIALKRSTKNCNVELPLESFEIEMILKKNIELIPDPLYRRFGATIDLDKFIITINSLSRKESYQVLDDRENFDDLIIERNSLILRKHLESLNESIREQIDNCLKNAVHNVTLEVLYDFVIGDQWRIQESRKRQKIIKPYFTHTNISECCTLKDIEGYMYGAQGRFFMAHNGWIISGNANPLEDFAAPHPQIENVYLQRELCIWDDSVKLRYGRGPDDNQYLWEHMIKYVETTAQIFDGVRIDNCHSTPLHVAEYLLDAGRRVNPNLYVVAELFTNSKEKDLEFVRRVGINALIREAFSAYDPHDLGRLVYNYGGEPVGSFFSSIYSPSQSVPAFFMDWTHDNLSPLTKRTIYDIMPNAALVALSNCAIGSNRGYDELVPHQIDVVKETRLYQEWETHLNLKSGIIKAKRALNRLHQQLAREGYTQIFVDQMEPDIITVTRNAPLNQERVILVAYTAFKNSGRRPTDFWIKSLKFEGQLHEIILEAELQPICDDTSFEEFQPDPIYINGEQQYELVINEQVALAESRFVRIVDKKNSTSGLESEKPTEIHFCNFKPGCIVIIKAFLNEIQHGCLQHLKRILPICYNRNCNPLEDINLTSLRRIISKLNLVDLNIVLFVCQQEEKQHSTKSMERGVYNVPGYGDLTYAGLQGIISITRKIAETNDLGHPLCNNLRNGNWLMDYIANRLERFPNIQDLAWWLKIECFQRLKRLPRYLIPCYFDACLQIVYQLILEHTYRKMSKYIAVDGGDMLKLLAVSTLQFFGICPDVCLPEMSSLLPASKPKKEEKSITLAAGLPHFSTGYMRCWGRDTFISLRGLLFLTGRYGEARNVIIAFAQAIRHGLIPNLLYAKRTDSLFNARFNSRDAVWWWLYSISKYVEEVHYGYRILYDKVSRFYPTDNSEQKPNGAYDQDLIDVIYEVLETHFQGLKFRERNAGRGIDAHMRDQGFDIVIGVHLDTGFVNGGNRWNCGTWMDKMGSSLKAGNQGYPSTPRDGSAVELVGLQYAVLRFMQKMYEDGYSNYEHISKIGSDNKIICWTFKEWADRIQENFESCFYVSENSGIVDERGNQIRRENIYKDTYGSSKMSNDYQLRCNFPIAMVVAPDLFDSEHAWLALENVRNHLLGPLGIRTLDPDDENYCDCYDQSNDSSDPKVAHGANYHQGPEWLWPLGYYLRARLYFAKKLDCLEETIKDTWQILREHAMELNKSDWLGLPELTNGNGAHCIYSCPAQAWSVATIIEVFHDLHYKYNCKK